MTLALRERQAPLVLTALMELMVQLGRRGLLDRREHKERQDQLVQLVLLERLVLKEIREQRARLVQQEPTVRFLDQQVLLVQLVQQDQQVLILLWLGQQVQQVQLDRKVMLVPQDQQVLLVLLV